MSLIAATCDAAAGRIQVVAGVIVDSSRVAIRRGKAVRDMNVAALQVTPVHYLFRPTDDAMVEHFRVMAEETGVPIIIYNVIPWNYLSVDLMLRIMDEVPGVITTLWLHAVHLIANAFWSIRLFGPRRPDLAREAQAQRPCGRLQCAVRRGNDGELPPQRLHRPLQLPRGDVDVLPLQLLRLQEGGHRLRGRRLRAR